MKVVTGMTYLGSELAEDFSFLAYLLCDFGKAKSLNLSFPICKLGTIINSSLSTVQRYFD